MSDTAEPRRQAIGHILLENGDIRVIEWVIGPGEESGWHEHAFDYVNIQLSSGTLQVELPNGSIATMPQQAGGAKVIPAGTRHNVVNVSDRPFRSIDIDLKSTERPLIDPSDSRLFHPPE